MPRRQATILFVEDELSILHEFARMLEREGHRVLAVSHPEEALRIIGTEKRIDIAIADLQLPMDGAGQIGLQEAAGGRQAGLVVAKELRKKFRKAPIIFWTGSYDRELRSKVLALGNARLIPKAAGAEPVLDIVADTLSGFRSGKRPRTFIVHGHDQQTMRSVKEFLQTELKFPEPVILRDMPSHGKTIIEKLESHTYSVDLVFVLLTPDDKVVTSGSSSEEMYRSRQNVIFEMGYFLGALGRSTGRVILLYRHPIELPSDIWGMVSIDITDGVLAAAAEIRQELSEWL